MSAVAKKPVHVVLALNSSEHSKYAFQWALENFLQVNVHKVTLLTVVEPPIQAGYYYAASAAMYSPAFIDEVYKKAQEDATKLVREYQAQLEKHFDNKMECEMVVGRGETRDEIVDYVESVKSDLLIIGSRDLSTLKRTFIGSTSDYCVHHCHCPILIAIRNENKIFYIRQVGGEKGMSRLLKLVRPKQPFYYEQVIKLQDELVKSCTSDGIDSVLVVRHMPTFTAGRRSAGFTAEHGPRLSLLGAKVYDTNRGGQVTFHGLGQLIVYPIIDLRRFNPNLRWYVDSLSKVMIKTCQQFGLLNVQSKDSTGVWVEGSRKIGFIGFHNSRWITSHGFALNVQSNLSWFSHIEPCGEKEMKITSLEEELGFKIVDFESTTRLMIKNFEEVFECTILH